MTASICSRLWFSTLPNSPYPALFTKKSIYPNFSSICVPILRTSSLCEISQGYATVLDHYNVYSFRSTSYYYNLSLKLSILSVFVFLPLVTQSISDIYFYKTLLFTSRSWLQVPWAFLIRKNCC
jgi:hypothetical protein